MLADGGGADVGGDVLRDALLLEVLEVLRERRPGDVVLQVALVGLHLPLHRVREGPHRRALAEDLRRHALPDLALRAPVDEQRLGRPGEHVDEAGRDREAAGVDHHVARQGGHGADRLHAVAADGDVRHPAGGARPVVHGPPAEDRAGRVSGGADDGRGHGQDAESEAAHASFCFLSGDQEGHVTPGSGNARGRFRACSRGCR